MSRDRSQKQSYGSLYNLIKEARILLVGAGGIGCELLKNLVLTGYGEIHVLDLDTIDLSNLNRQFLFRHEHIKMSKATVAKEVAQKFNPAVKLVAYHADITDPKFNIGWFSQFTLVFNALDNLAGRRYVNKMCLMADIPLVESGTTGFNGQVQVIKKGKTACYDCSPKTTPKSFPVCTIRSTPSQPIHTIVWAKNYLLPELFGESEEDVSELDSASDAENAEEIAKLKEEAAALKQIRESMGSDDFAKKVFDKVFREDIERLASMVDVWKQRKPPTPLSYDTLKSESESIDTTIVKTDQRAWTTPETFVVFNDSLSRLSTRFKTEAEAAVKAGLPQPLITFDKDDEDTLDFVTASACLRSVVFGIEPKSKFDTKQMAGNIIPAIATTNAMIAGLCVLQAFKIMKERYARSKMIFLERGNMSAGNVDPPNPECPVCSTAMSRLEVDLEKATLGDLVNEILKKELGYGEDISITRDQDLIFDIDMEDNLEKKLHDLKVGENSFLLIKDGDEENTKVDLQLLVEAKKNGDANDRTVALVQKPDQKLEIPLKPQEKDVNGLPGAGSEPEVTENGTSTAKIVAKRKREADDGEPEAAAPVKKVQAGPSGKANDAIILDGDEGAIEIID